MPEAKSHEEDPNQRENVKPKNGNDKKLKKSATSNGLGSFARGKLVLARVNMLDGTVTDLSIEVSEDILNTLVYLLLFIVFLVGLYI